MDRIDVLLTMQDYCHRASYEAPKGRMRQMLDIKYYGVLNGIAQFFPIWLNKNQGRLMLLILWQTCLYPDRLSTVETKFAVRAILGKDATRTKREYINQVNFTQVLYKRTLSNNF